MSFSSFSDLFIVAGVVAIIALMIFPLPTFLIDTLVALNISFGIVLLLMSIYITRALDFSVFPSVLLISTLFRLALSVATTRLILLDADAGQIIETFGATVAGGNLVVGLVVFLIITVVQFIVIAKGAERVAEVSARFSLDGMPGKQLSIDSDLRAGLITKDEARRKRKVLELDSKLHGNLDGAMKFVKGDAIASLVIIFINIVGGLTIGILQQGMSFSAALGLYSILTIGDGLVAQTPALLSAMAAGLIVTRTTDEDDERHLGESIRQELTSHPRVLLVAGALCWGFALVPGFPSIIFVIIGTGAAVTGLLLIPRFRERMEQPAGRLYRIVNPDAVEIEEPSRPMLMVTPSSPRPVRPIHIEVLAHRLDELEIGELQRSVDLISEAIERRLGLMLPAIAISQVRQLNKDWQLSVYETPLVGGLFESDSDKVGEISAATEEALARYAGEFIGIQETSEILARANGDYPDLVKELLRAVPVAKLSDVLRRLVEEGVPIRNLRALLEGIADAAQREKDPGALAEHARIALRRELNHLHAPDGTMTIMVLEPQLEAELRQHASKAASGSQQLPMSPVEAKSLVSRVSRASGASDSKVLLTTIDLRRPVRKLIEQDLFDVAVLSYNELMPHLQLHVGARIPPTDQPASAVAAE